MDNVVFAWSHVMARIGDAKKRIGLLEVAHQGAASGRSGCCLRLLLCKLDCKPRSLVIHGLSRTVSGQVKAHVVPTCTNGARSLSCDCGQRQTMNHIVDHVPTNKFEGGLNLLHEADDDAVCVIIRFGTREINNNLAAVTDTR